MKTPVRSEGSVTFSLGELMKLEDERVAEQMREREANERAAVEAKVLAERQERAAAEARARAEEDAVERRRRQELDELARREAMQRATVEQARLEVEARTRADERERERQHEVVLQNARAVRPKPTSLGALIGATGLGGGLMLLVTCILHFGVNQPNIDRRIAELELRDVTAEHKLTEADANADKLRKTIASIEKRNADLESENKTLKDDLAKAPVKPTTPNRPKGDAHPPAAPVKPEKECDPHDPMCFSIKRTN